MATKTVTIGANEVEYIDADGQPHVVKTDETFTFTLTDGGAAAVVYNLMAGQNFLCNDGSRVHILPMADGSNQTLKITTLADTQDATTLDNISGEIPMKNDMCGTVQNWRIAKLLVNNVDAPTQLTMTLEDQFGNVMQWAHPKATNSYLTVA